MHDETHTPKKRGPRAGGSAWGRYAAAVRANGAEAPATVEARREYELARARDQITRIVAAAPALSEQDRVALAALVLSARVPGNA